MYITYSHTHTQNCISHTHIPTHIHTLQLGANWFIDRPGQNTVATLRIVRKQQQQQQQQ